MRYAVLAVVALCVVATSAWAQSTGGRFGGSRGFGGGREEPSPPSPSGSWERHETTPSAEPSFPRVHFPEAPAPPAYHPSSPPSSSSSSSTSSPPRAITVLEYRPPPPGAGTIERPRAELAPPVTAAEAAFLAHPQFDHVRDPANRTTGQYAGLALFVAGVFFTVFVGAGIESKGDPKPQFQKPSCEIRRVSIAFDWTERARLQSALASAAASMDTLSAPALVNAAEASRTLLRDALPAARYAMFQSSRVTRDRADAAFATLVGALARRYRERIVDGTHRTAPSNEIVANSEEGAGLVVVSIVVGTSSFLRKLPSTLDRASLRKVLDDLLPRNGDDLVALEVTWSPAAESDRLSSAELEVVHPDLVRLDDAGNVGRMRCTFCGAIHAAELRACPACGARDSKHAERKPDGVTGLTDIACRYCGRDTPAYEVRCRHCGARASR